MALVGPGSVKQDIIAPTPTLDGASEYEYVTILNPLTDDFQVNVAQDIPVNLPFELKAPTSMTQTAQDVTREYGLNLKNPDYKSKKYIYNQAIIPAGKTMNFKGNEAQVVVRQLVNEILQREGKRRLMADPALRKEVEDRIIQSRGSIQELLDERLQTPQEAINAAVNQSNEVTNEFPGLNQPVKEDGSRGRDSGDADPAPEKRTPGRPKKT